MGRKIWVVKAVTSQPFPGGPQWRCLLPTWFLSTPWGHQGSIGMAQALLCPALPSSLSSLPACWTQLPA